MAGHGTKYARKKDGAIAALLSTRTLEEAAREADISVRTLLRWLKRDDFQQDYLAARRSVVGAAMARLQSAAGAAASTIVKSLIDPNLSPAERLRAARLVLAMADKGLERDDFELRLARVEKIAGSDEADGPRV